MKIIRITKKDLYEKNFKTIAWKWVYNTWHLSCILWTCWTRQTGVFVRNFKIPCYSLLLPAIVRYFFFIHFILELFLHKHNILKQLKDNGSHWRKWLHNCYNCGYIWYYSMCLFTAFISHIEINIFAANIVINSLIKFWFNLFYYYYQNVWFINKSNFAIWRQKTSYY